MLHASHFLTLPSFRSVVIPTQLENLPTAANAKWLDLAISGRNHKCKCSQTRSTAQHFLAKQKKKTVGKSAKAKECKVTGALPVDVMYFITTHQNIFGGSNK